MAAMDTIFVQSTGAALVPFGDANAEALRGLPLDALFAVKPRALDKRSEDQNKKLWASLRDVAEQVVWHGVKLADHEWKDVFTAALKRSKVVPGLDGGFVVVGGRTSRMTKAEFGDLLTLIVAFGDERGVAWTAPIPQGDRDDR